MTSAELAGRYAEGLAIGEASGSTRSDTWPNSRPLIDWALQLEPGDGTNLGTPAPLL